MGRKVTVHYPTSRAALALVSRLDGVTVLPARGFLVPHEEFRAWADARAGGRLRQEDSYRRVRREHDILMDGDQPQGGRWNFDRDNREAPPGDAAVLDVLAPYRPREDGIDDEVRGDLDRWARDVGAAGQGARRRPAVRVGSGRQRSDIVDQQLERGAAEQAQDRQRCQRGGGGASSHRGPS